MTRTHRHGCARIVNQAGSLVRYLAVLLLVAINVQACSHARVRDQAPFDLSGVWEGEGIGSIYMPKGATWRGQSPPPFPVLLRLELVDSVGQVTGMGDLASDPQNSLGIEKRGPPGQRWQVSGSLRNRRVKFVLESTIGLSPIAFTGNLTAPNELQGSLEGSGLIVPHFKLKRLP